MRVLCAGNALAMLAFQSIFEQPIPYCSAASKHRQLLATEVCGNDHSENGVLITRVAPVGNTDLSELLFLGGFVFGGFSIVSLRNTLLGVPF